MVIFNSYVKLPEGITCYHLYIPKMEVSRVMGVASIPSSLHPLRSPEEERRLLHLVQQPCGPLPATRLLAARQEGIASDDLGLGKQWPFFSKWDGPHWIIGDDIWDIYIYII